MYIFERFGDEIQSSWGFLQNILRDVYFRPRRTEMLATTLLNQSALQYNEATLQYNGPAAFARLKLEPVG